MARAIAASLQVMRGIKKNPMCLPGSEGEFSTTAHSTASNSLHPDLLHLPLGP